VYYGFKVMEDVAVDGFVFGIISDFEAEPSEWGDAFVIAPDGSRAGLVREIGESAVVCEILPIERGRWGVWGVTFSTPMRNRNDARQNLAAILPLLRNRWQEWRDKFFEPPK
jgi:hypothetical protein